MREYDIKKVKFLFNEGKYNELVQIVNKIRTLGNYDKEDIEILNYLFKNKDVNTYLYETMIVTYDEFKNKFMNESKKSDDDIEYQIDQSPISLFQLSDLKKLFKDKKIELTEFKLENEERPKISVKVEEQNLPYIYNIMKMIYKEKLNDIGFEIISLKSIEYDIFTIYLLPSTMADDVIETQINKMKKLIANSILSTNLSINYKYDVPHELNEFIDYFKNAKIRYFSENFKVCYIRNLDADKFYLVTNNREELLDLDKQKKEKYYNNSKIVSFDNKPYVSTNKSAYVNTKSLGFVIFLTILVIIAVTILTLKG